jgi:CheY-like chemotaxis protein
VARLRAENKELRGKLDAALKGPFLIALTADTLAEDRKKSLEAGFNVHLAKPADPGELCQLILDGR